MDGIYSGHFREHSQANVWESKPYDPVHSLVYCKKTSCSTVLDWHLNTDIKRRWAYACVMTTLDHRDM